MLLSESQNIVCAYAVGAIDLSVRGLAHPENFISPLAIDFDLSFAGG